MENTTIEYFLSLIGIVVSSAFLGGLFVWPIARTRGYLAGFEACSEIWKSHNHNFCEVCEDIDCLVCGDDDEDDDSILTSSLVTRQEVE